MFTVNDRESSSNIRVFSTMMNCNVHMEYLEDLFRLYVTMLERNELGSADNPLVVSKAKATGMLKFLLSIYFDEKTANDVVVNLPVLGQFEVDLNVIFIVVETQLRKYTSDTEVYQFMAKLLPENQSNIEFTQLK